MKELKGKRVLIFQQRGWAINIGHFLAKRLQGEGCKLAAFTLKLTTHKFILEQKEVKYDFLVSNDEIMANPKAYLDGDEFSLKEICSELGINSIWPLVYSLRNHVKSYKDKYYYGFKQNVPDEEIEAYVKACYKFIKFIFSSFGPDVIVAPNIIALPHVMMNLYANRNGVEMIAVTDSKIKGYYLFSHSYQDDRGFFYDYIDSLNNGEINTENRDMARKYIKDFRENFIKPEAMDRLKKQNKKLNFVKILRRELSPYKQILRWYIKGPSENYLESTGITLDYKPPKIILRDHYYHKKYKKFIDNFSYYPFDKIKKFIYFPLQFQPEATMDVIAPYFNNQIETARQVAMSMPDDYTLVVKEHPAMAGLRASSYIEKIARIPNVKLINYQISSEEVLKKTDLVISPNSTTVAEAAFLNKPAIQLGNLGTTFKLPNVFKHSDMTTLSSKIKEVLKIDLYTKEYETRLENFVASVYDIGFNFKYTTVWEKGRGDDKENLWELYKKEIIKSLKK